jgi:hypothetical protein
LTAWHCGAETQRSIGMTLQRRVQVPIWGTHVHSLSVAQVVASVMELQVRLQKPPEASQRHSGWAEHSAKDLYDREQDCRQSPLTCMQRPVVPHLLAAPRAEQVGTQVDVALSNWQLELLEQSAAFEANISVQEATQPATESRRQAVLSVQVAAESEAQL